MPCDFDDNKVGDIVDISFSGPHCSCCNCNSPINGCFRVRYEGHGTEKSGCTVAFLTTIAYLSGLERCPGCGELLTHHIVYCSQPGWLLDSLHAVLPISEKVEKE